MVIPEVSRYEEVVFILMVTDLSGTRLSYDYRISAGPSIQKASDLLGDFNGDMQVNFSDFLAFSSGFAKSHLDLAYDQRLDLNADGPVNFLDFLIFVAHFGETG